jgi:hypothetical protein
MMSRHASSPRRRAGLFLPSITILIALAGCEPPDETIRGAGSIDIPPRGLASPAPSAAEDRPRQDALAPDATTADAGLDAISPRGPIPADQYFIPDGGID